MLLRCIYLRLVFTSFQLRHAPFTASVPSTGILVSTLPEQAKNISSFHGDQSFVHLATEDPSFEFLVFRFLLLVIDVPLLVLTRLLLLLSPDPIISLSLNPVQSILQEPFIASCKVAGFEELTPTQDISNNQFEKRMLDPSMSLLSKSKVQALLSNPYGFSCWAVFNSHHSFYVAPGDLISISKSQSLNISLRVPAQSEHDLRKTCDIQTSLCHFSTFAKSQPYTCLPSFSNQTSVRLHLQLPS
ncbi:hypothetical protein Tco_0441613 [Tanacetum coccineum]